MKIKMVKDESVKYASSQEIVKLLISEGWQFHQKEDADSLGLTPTGREKKVKDSKKK